MKNFTKIYYRAFSKEPFAPDAYGYVDEKDLIDGLDDNYLDYPDDGNDPVPCEGYKWVYANENGNGDFWLIDCNNIYTEVFEESALEGGYGMPHPTGGLTSTDDYDLEYSTDDGNTIYLKQHYY